MGQALETVLFSPERKVVFLVLHFYFHVFKTRHEVLSILYLPNNSDLFLKQGHYWLVAC